MLASMKSTPKQEAPGSLGPSLHSAMSDLFVAGTLREVAAGQFLFRQGDRADRVFLIRKGRLHLGRHLASGHAVTIHAAHDLAVLPFDGGPIVKEPGTCLSGS